MFIPRVILNAFLLAIVASSALAQLEEVGTLLSRRQSGYTPTDATIAMSNCVQQQSNYNAYRQCVQKELARYTNNNNYNNDGWSEE